MRGGGLGEGGLGFFFFLSTILKSESNPHIRSVSVLSDIIICCISSKVTSDTWIQNIQAPKQSEN